MYLLYSENSENKCYLLSLLDSTKNLCNAIDFCSNRVIVVLGYIKVARVSFNILVIIIYIAIDQINDFVANQTIYLFMLSFGKSYLL